jgi:hypothetical protein
MMVRLHRDDPPGSDKGDGRKTCPESGQEAAQHLYLTHRNPFRYFKTSPEIIRLAVMLSVRCPSSLSNVEDVLPGRCVDVGHNRVVVRH